MVTLSPEARALINPKFKELMNVPNVCRVQTWRLPTKKENTGSHHQVSGPGQDLCVLIKQAYIHVHIDH